jgi:hypothetical protein
MDNSAKLKVGLGVGLALATIPLLKRRQEGYDPFLDDTGFGGAYGRQNRGRGRRDPIPEGVDHRIRRRLERWYGLLEQRGQPEPTGDMALLVDWMRATRPDLTTLSGPQAMRAAGEWASEIGGAPRAHHYRALGAPQDGLVRINDNFPLAKVVSNELQVDLAYRGDSHIWNAYNDRFGLFAFFRNGKPRWVVAASPRNAEPADLTSIREARKRQNMVVGDDPDFQRLFGHVPGAGQRNAYQGGSYECGCS